LLFQEVIIKQNIKLYKVILHTVSINIIKEEKILQDLRNNIKLFNNIRLISNNV
jgi:hypothetical protein